jgi:hypothetical protein
MSATQQPPPPGQGIASDSAPWATRVFAGWWLATRWRAGSMNLKSTLKCVPRPRRLLGLPPPRRLLCLPPQSRRLLCLPPPRRLLGLPPQSRRLLCLPPQRAARCPKSNSTINFRSSLTARAVASPRTSSSRRIPMTSSSPPGEPSARPQRLRCIVSSVAPKHERGETALV